jgi:carbon-monoxide dehydrogenase large subunit
VTAPVLGVGVQRLEDERLLSGGAHYLGDMSVPGMLTAVVVRSIHAHATITNIDVEAAKAVPGVVAVITPADLGEAQKPVFTDIGEFAQALLDAWKPTVRKTPMYPLANGKVRFVGEAIALVIAVNAYVAEDAASLVAVDYEPLPVVTDTTQSLGADAPRLFEDWEDNVAVHVRAGIGNIELAFAEAQHKHREIFSSHRYAGVPLEGRAMLAVPDPGNLGLTIWSNHQLPHSQKETICVGTGLPPGAVRVVQGDSGGGFGPKAVIYPEDVLIAWAALHLGRPVRWMEDQREQFLASTHSREQRFDVEVAFDSDGMIRGLRYSALIDAGAYIVYPVVLPVIGMGHMLGPYRIPAFAADVRTVLTNKASSAPYRGAGRPEAVFVLNRVIDRIAQTVGMDPIDVRRRNMIEASALPYSPGILFRDGNPLVLDSGDYPALLEKCVTAIGYDEFRKEQAAARSGGRFLGIGFSCNVESTGIGPFEGARVEIDLDGRVWVHTGVADSGQGQRTTLAQVCADALGVPLSLVTVLTGDTAGIAYGMGTYHSRAAVTAGSSVHLASVALRKKTFEIAAAKLEVSPADLEIVDGEIRVKGVPGASLTLASCARLSSPFGDLPEGMTPGLEETCYFKIHAPTWSSAAHAAIVQVDPSTGRVEILRYVVAHDCGRQLNPLIVAGQLRGGVVAGIGGTMLEEIIYSAEGQLLTTTLMDYMLPRIGDVPNIELIAQETPSPLNPLGVKGVGEGGTIGPPATLTAAVEDALSPFGVRFNRTPLDPHLILEMLREATRGERPAV